MDGQAVSQRLLAIIEDRRSSRRVREGNGESRLRRWCYLDQLCLVEGAPSKVADSQLEWMTVAKKWR